MSIFDEKDLPKPEKRVFRGIETAGFNRQSKMKRRRQTRSEQAEQEDVVRLLRKNSVCFCAVPNGGRRDRRTAISLKKGGVEKGVPDLLIFDAPPLRPDKVGVALEMKREKSVPSAVRKEQREWLQKLEERGWISIVGKGAKHALEELRGLGYDI